MNIARISMKIQTRGTAPSRLCWTSSARWQEPADDVQQYQRVLANEVVGERRLLVPVPANVEGLELWCLFGQIGYVIIGLLLPFQIVQSGAATYDGNFAWCCCPDDRRFCTTAAVFNSQLDWSTCTSQIICASVKQNGRWF